MIYVVIIDDTHADTDVELHSTAEAAIDSAKAVAREGAGIYVDDIEEETIEGYLYYARYSPDSKVWVVEKELDET
jgi:hypothetical protein